jgi:hypothetical protein
VAGDTAAGQLNLSSRLRRSQISAVILEATFGAVICVWVRLCDDVT